MAQHIMQYLSICLSKIKKTCVREHRLMNGGVSPHFRTPSILSVMKWQDFLTSSSVGRRTEDFYFGLCIILTQKLPPCHSSPALNTRHARPEWHNKVLQTRHNKWLRNKWRRLILSASQKIGTCTRRCFFMCMCFIRRSASTKKKTLGYQLGISTGFPNWCMTTKVQINMEWPSWAMCMLNVEYKQDRKANSLKGTVHHLFNFKPVWFSFYIGNQTTMTFMF